MMVMMMMMMMMMYVYACPTAALPTIHDESRLTETPRLLARSLALL